jgi:alpha-ketoglutarate-dependent taurine dioxygenase
MAQQLEVRDLHPGFGSEVVGLDSSRPIDAGSARALRRIFDERGLVLVRDPDLSLGFQTELSYTLIGEAPPAATADGPDRSKDAYYVSNKEPKGGAPFGRLLYHSDGMWLEKPFQLLSLYGVRVDPPVTPTSFVSTVNAWNTLPDELRGRLEGLHVEHGHDATYGRDEDDADVLVSTFDEEESTITSIGHTHPRTGATMLYASQMMTTRIVELPGAEGEALLEEVFAHLYSAANVLEHTWSEGDLVLWDNIALQHARPNVAVEGPTRTLRKVFAPAPVVTATTRRPTQRTRAEV